MNTWSTNGKLNKSKSIPTDEFGTILIYCREKKTRKKMLDNIKRTGEMRDAKKRFQREYNGINKIMGKIENLCIVGHSDCDNWISIYCSGCLGFRSLFENLRPPPEKFAEAKSMGRPPYQKAQSFAVYARLCEAILYFQEVKKLFQEFKAQHMAITFNGSQIFFQPLNFFSRFGTLQPSQSTFWAI